MANFNISNDGSIGVLNNAGGDINTTNIIHVINTINVPNQTPEESPTGLRFQVADPVASFGGRDEELESVQRAFEEQKNMKPYNLVAVCGYGGIGKTEFARKFVENNRTNFHNLIWIHSEFESTLCDSFNKLKEELKDSGYPCPGHQDVYKHLNNPECLFVFDNAENKKSICKYLPQQHNNSLFLITSQYRTWSPHKSIELNKLDPASAINIMKVILGTHDIEISESQLQQLLNTLEPIPLVLQIGVGFVCQEVLGLKSIDKEYNIDDIIGELSAECELVTLEFPPFDQTLYDKSVLVALRRTLEKFWNKEDKVSKAAKNMLEVAAYLSADDIEENTLKKLLNMKDEKLFNKSLTILVQFSLFQKTYNIRMHRTVQECVRHLCANKSKLNECYLQSLQLLLDWCFFQHHQLVIIQHAEKNFETFKLFYEGKKCRTLYKFLAEHISCNILQLFLDNTDIINEPEFLYEAVAKERNDIIEKLLEHGTDFNVMNSDGLGVLYYACCSNEFLEDTWEIIQALIKVGANINLQNSQGNTVLHILCNSGKNCSEPDVDLFKRFALMVKAGADPIIKNSAGKTAGDLAQEHGLPRTRRLLEEAKSGCKCIQHLTARCKLFNILESLLNLNICDIEEQDESGNTVLHVLAGLDPLPAEDEVNEIKLPYFTADIIPTNTDFVAVKNKSGETAADVATRANRMQLADMFQARVSGHTIYDTDVYRQQIEHFSFVSDHDLAHVDDTDVNGGTLLHALCGLDAHGHPDLELEVVKLVAGLVILDYADVRIRDDAGVTAADVARSRGWCLLADFLDDDDVTVSGWELPLILRAKLMYLAVKHRQFHLINYTWWRYFRLLDADFNIVPVKSASKLLRAMCGCGDTTVTDADIISALNVLDIYKLVAEYKADKYQKAIDAANECGRNQLANWLIAHQSNPTH